MYAVLFDVDTSCLTENFEGRTYHDAYRLIKDFMLENSFQWKQGSVYFGKENVDSVHCVLTVQALSKKYDWFATCVKDIRMLRIEENNDLALAL